MERELEEVVETCDDFLALSKKYFAGKAAAGNHLEIGDGAIIGGRSSALSSIEPGAQVAGHPAIDRRNWARSIALFRRLPELFKRLRRIESQLGVDSD